jgi:hypothetical protein
VALRRNCGPETQLWPNSGLPDGGSVPNQDSVPERRLTRSAQAHPIGTGSPDRHRLTRWAQYQRSRFQWDQALHAVPYRTLM